MASKATNKEIAEKVNELRELLPPGTTVHTILRHVSRSGMFRRIGTVLLKPNGETYHLDYPVNVIVNERCLKYNDPEGVPVSGCGMDMGFQIVYCLSSALYPDGFDCIGKDCLANDHFNGDRDYTPHRHNDGGYALKQRWL